MASKRFQIILVTLLINNILGFINDASEGDSKEERLGLNPRIEGGKEAYPTEAPFAVAVYIGKVYVCTFTIITKRTIIGPAHCLMENDYDHYPLNSIHGRVGNVNRNNGTLINFGSVNIHKKYHLRKHNPFDVPDIATLITDRRLIFDYYTNSINIAPANLYDIHVGAKVSIYGWGSLINALEDSPQVLRKVSATIVPLNVCQDYDIYFCTQLIFPRHTSSGDDGAPVIYQDENGHRFFVGFLYKSHESGGTKDVTDINIAVTMFSRWIIRHTKF